MGIISFLVLVNFLDFIVRIFFFNKNYLDHLVEHLSNYPT